MASSVLKILRGLITGFLVFTFFAAGLVKLSDKISVKVHEQMKSDFVRFAKVHPAAQYGYNIDPLKYMKQVGMIELAGATFLLIGPRLLKLLSCLLLSSIMIGAMYTLHQLKEPVSMLAVPAITLFFLFLKLHFLLIGNTKTSNVQNTKKTD